MLICPIHRVLCSASNDCKCPKCEAEGITTIICELDKISRTQDTMHEQGFETLHARSYAVIVFDTRSRPNA
jgi:hypothetical protein